MDSERIIVPYNAAGIHAFEVIREVAEKLYNKGLRITGDFAREAAPDAETIAAYCKGGKCIRTLQAPEGRQITIAYDYKTKEVRKLTAREARAWEMKRNILTTRASITHGATTRNETPDPDRAKNITQKEQAL